MNFITVQTELTLAGVEPTLRSASTQLDWPLRPLPTATVRELRRLSARWSDRAAASAASIQNDEPSPTRF